jgi:CO/xanthine dehydrogenase Mo-binding subunit
MNAPFSINRRNLLKSTGFLALSFAIPADLGFAQDAPDLPGDLKNNPMLGAWFRIGADGKATLMVGKVELGQGAVTAMKQVAADELGVSWDQLDVISGDTELCPNEGTTAGSQSMPNGAVAVRQAAAEIRETGRRQTRSAGREHEGRGRHHHGRRRPDRDLLGAG